MKDRTTSRRRIQTSLPPEVLARIDALIVRFSKPERRATRAEILRELVRLGLAELDATEGRGAPVKRAPRAARRRRR
jgi:metal-responsive CopG/Arc/MetJ family transcriptional regulator